MVDLQDDDQHDLREGNCPWGIMGGFKFRHDRVLADLAQRRLRIICVLMIRSSLRSTREVHELNEPHAYFLMMSGSSLRSTREVHELNE